MVEARAAEEEEYKGERPAQVENRILDYCYIINLGGKQAFCRIMILYSLYIIPL